MGDFAGKARGVRVVHQHQVSLEVKRILSSVCSRLKTEAAEATSYKVVLGICQAIGHDKTGISDPDRP